MVKTRTQQTKLPKFHNFFKEEVGSENTSAFTWLKFLSPPPPKWLVSSQNRQVFWQLDVFTEGQNQALLSLAEKQGHAEMALPVAQKGVATLF